MTTARFAHHLTARPLEDPMTQPQPLDLDQIEARAQAATPGPWGVYEFGYMIEIAADLEDTGHGYHARRVLARFDEEPLDNDPTHREWTAEEDWAQVQADAKFIAAMSPETVKAMAAEIRRLRDRVTELERLTAPRTPRLCACGHSHFAHTVPAPHSCFAYGQTCPCEAYQQLPHDEAVAQLERNRQAAAERAAARP
jgi:hypothetical protein